MRWFDNWIASRDQDLLTKAHTRAAWATVAVGVVVITAIWSWLVDSFSVADSVTWALPMFFAGVPMIQISRWTDVRRAAWALDLTQVGAMVFWFASITAAAEPVLALWVVSLALTLSITGYFAYQYGTTLRYPFVMLVMAPAILVGYGWSPTTQALVAVPAFWVILGELGQVHEKMARTARAQAEVAAIADTERKTAAYRRQVSNFSCERRDMDGMVRRLQGNIELLRMDGDLDLDIAGIASVAETLSKILDGSELTPAEQREARPVGVDVWPTLVEVVHKMRKRFPAIKFDLDDCDQNEIMVNVHGGDAALRTILSNVVENAVEASGGRGWVRLELGHPDASDDEPFADVGDRVVIAVQDAGPGFSQALLDDGPRQFQTTKPHGRGIGLWMAAAMVRLSLGKMTLSNLGAGAYARVEIELERHDRNL